MIALRTMLRAAVTAACLGLWLGGGCASSSSGGGKGGHERPMIKTGFLDKAVTMPNGAVRKYVVFIPTSYTPERKWPAILFLHGAGERGSDNRAQIRVGIAPAIRKRVDSFGFITVMPQCVTKKWWTASSELDGALAALAKTRQEYAIDPARIHLTGLSMGGHGTWTLAVKEPKRWASIVPVCGLGDPRHARAIAHLPCWCFHGAADGVVPVLNSRDMVNALKKAGGKPRYTEYAGVGHNSWDRAYGTEELYTWMLAQRRK